MKLIKTIMLVAGLSLFLVACGGGGGGGGLLGLCEEERTCTITKSNGEEDVYDDISREECERIFQSTVGAVSMSWERKNCDL